MIGAGNKPKVLYLSAWYPNKDLPLGGIFVRRYAECVTSNYDIAAIHVKSSELNNCTFEISNSTYENIREIVVYYNKNNSFLAPVINAFLFVISFIKAWRIYLRYFGKPNLIHVNVLTRFGLLAYVLFVIYNIPYIITEHWTRYLPGNNTFNGFLRKKITQLVVSKAKAVTVVTKNLETAMKQHGLKNNNYKLIYNVVNTYKFRIIENLEQPPKKRIIHISNFYDRNKNIVGILKCMKELSRTRNDFECYCIGINEGDTTDYADVAHKMGILNSVVFFRGLLQAERIAEEFNQSCFFVLYSNFENLPVVMLESWACGLPVLVTNVGGISEHVNSKLGVMVEPKDDTAFIKALNYMLDNYKTYNKETIREYALQHFSEQTISKQLDELYKLTMTPVKC